MSDRRLPIFRVISPSDQRLHCAFCGSVEVEDGKEGDHYQYCDRVPIERMLCGTVCLNRCKGWHEGTCPAKRTRSARIQADKDFDFAIKRMQDKFIDEGQLARPATHAVDYMHRPHTSLLMFLTGQMVADGAIPIGLQALYDQARNSPAAIPPMPMRVPPTPDPVSPQPRRSSAAIRRRHHRSRHVSMTLSVRHGSGSREALTFTVRRRSAMRSSELRLS